MLCYVMLFFVRKLEGVYQLDLRNSRYSAAIPRYSAAIPRYSAGVATLSELYVTGHAVCQRDINTNRLKVSTGA